MWKKGATITPVSYILQASFSLKVYSFYVHIAAVYRFPLKSI